MPISLHELLTGQFQVPEIHVLRSVLARCEFGDVTIWRSNKMSWNWDRDVKMHTSAAPFFDLIVSGEPKLIASAMVTEDAFDRGLFEAPICMTLAQGLNWMHQWDKGSRSDKAEILDQLCWMSEFAHHRLNYDRYHFSNRPIEQLLCATDNAMRLNDWAGFVLNIKRLYKHELMGSRSL